MSDRTTNGSAPAYPQTHFARPDGDIVWGGDGFAQRERACIDLRVAESGTPWLDEMIRKARRIDIATEILSGVITDLTWSEDEAAKLAFEQADALLKASNE